jgi:preprotein translocase subunit Sec61beta
MSLRRIASSFAMEIAPYIVLYIGIGVLFSALVLILALHFMDPGGVDRDG